MHHKTSIGRTKLLPLAPVFSVLFFFLWCRLECRVLPCPLKDGAESGPREVSLVEREYLWPKHLCVSCPAESALVQGAGSALRVSRPPEQTPAQPQGHARTNLLGAALICWVKHCAEGLGCFHLQSCQGAISVGGSGFGAAGPQKPRHELLLPAGVGGLFQWV